MTAGDRRGGDAPRLHGLVRLRRDSGSPVGVATVMAGDVADVFLPGDMPGHMVEMHVFHSAEAALGFSEGVAAAASNVVHASPACGPGRLVVLLARLDAEADRRAATLGEAVPLVSHAPGGDVAAASRLSDHEEEMARRRAAVAATRLSWSAVEAALAGFPKARKRLPGEFAWKIAEMDLLRLNGVPTGEAVIAGTFDPNPPHPHDEDFQLHTEHRVSLVRTNDGEVAARADLAGSDAAVTRSSVAWRIGEIEEACRAAGWGWDTASLLPIWTGRPETDGGVAMRAAFLALPGLVDAVRVLAGQAAGIARAAKLASDPQLAPIVRRLADDPDGRIIEAEPGRGAPRLVARDVERPITMGALHRLSQLGFVGIQAKRHGGEPRVWALTPRGLNAATTDAEALAAALRDGETRFVLRDGSGHDGEDRSGGPRR